MPSNRRLWGLLVMTLAGGLLLAAGPANAAGPTGAGDLGITIAAKKKKPKPKPKPKPAPKPTPKPTPAKPAPKGPAAGLPAVLKINPQEWPGWRGGNRDGKSFDTGLLKAWPEGGPRLVWKATGIGEGYSNITVAGGMIYTTGHKQGKLYLHGLSTKGKIVWSEEVGPGWTNPKPGSRSTPTYNEGNLYLVSGRGLIGCYDAKTGKEKWTRKMKEFGGSPSQWGYAESVLIVGDLAIVTPGGKNCIVALDKKTGEEVWQSWPFTRPGYSSPIYVEYKGVPMVINGTAGGIIGVHAKTGKTLWTNKFSAGNTANCPTPAFSDGYVFWATGYGKGGICLKLEVSGQNVTAKEAWRTKDMVCHHGGFVILNGYIYGNNGRGWACLDLKTGDKKWEATGVGKGSICYADGMLYLFGEKGGKVALAPATPTGLKLTGQFSVAGSGPSWAHPVVVRGRLGLRYSDNLYCFDVRAKKDVKAEK